MNRFNDSEFQEVFDHLVARYGEAGVTVRSVRAAMGGGDVTRIHYAIRQWLHGRATAPVAPDGNVVARVLEIASEYERVRQALAAAGAMVAARDAEVAALLSEMDLYVQEADVLRGHVARAGRGVARMRAALRETVWRGPVPGLAEAGAGEGIILCDEPKGNDEELLSWAGAHFFAEAVGDAPIYASGIQVGISDVVAADFLLPVLAVEMARMPGGTGLRCVLREDADALLGYRVTDLDLGLGTATVVRDAVLLADESDGEICLDGAVAGFVEWLRAAGLDSSSAEDADVRIALSL